MQIVIDIPDFLYKQILKKHVSDDYRGCWNCTFHEDADGFETHCAWSKSNNAIVYLRCPAWVKKGKENKDGSN